MRELDALGRAYTVDATTWPLDRLIDHILDTHHAYVRRQIPAIQALTRKLAAARGSGHPTLETIAGLFANLASELERHMEKEERILFPYVRAMFAAKLGSGRLPPNPFGTVGNPIRMMEIEHSAAGDDMRALRTLTDDYQPPPEACVTWRACYAELAEFERDLHEHVHLENNVLFPAAVRMEEDPS
jgi:regulator of cell morphogenesis and NO signaling